MMLLAKENQEFVKADQVTIIHVARYNSQINQLLQVQDCSEQDLIRGAVNKTEFFKARECKIRAYSDCINTLSQKEKLLQFHSTGFEVEFVQERTEVRQPRTQWDITKLSFEEKVELYGLMKKAKRGGQELLPISHANNIEEVKTEDVEYEEVSKPNIDLIKHEELPVLPHDDSIALRDPTIKLRKSLEKIAAKKFKEAGCTLNEEEEQIIRVLP